MECVGEIHKIKNLGIDDEAQMAINCEWVCRSSAHVAILIPPISLQGRV
jgi:hexokinase